MKKGEKPAVSPINRHEHRLLRTAKGKCTEDDGIHYSALRIVIVVKSALWNFDRRAAIRDTWGFERRFSDVPARTVFLVGTSESGELVGLRHLSKLHLILPCSIVSSISR